MDTFKKFYLLHADKIITSMHFQHHKKKTNLHLKTQINYSVTNTNKIYDKKNTKLNLQ